MSQPPFEIHRDQKLIAGITYALHALGILGTVVPVIVAIVVNYIKADDSLPLYQLHHRWMIRTFWWGLLWAVVGTALIIVLIGWAILFVVFVWWIYRLVKGFLALMDDRPVYPAGKRAR